MFYIIPIAPLPFRAIQLHSVRMQEVKSPHAYKLVHPAIFLAGSIEMGKATDWQKEVAEALDEHDGLILNPRREKWNSKWIQRMSNPQFRRQVEWELKALEGVDIIFFYFVPETISPISLLELGLFKDKTVIVCCPNGYWRKGNIEIVCKKYGIPLFEEMGKAMKRLRREVEKHK